MPLKEFLQILGNNSLIFLFLVLLFYISQIIEMEFNFLKCEPLIEDF